MHIIKSVVCFYNWLKDCQLAMLEHALKQLFLKKNLMEIFGRGQPDVDAVEALVHDAGQREGRGRAGAGSPTIHNH